MRKHIIGALVLLLSGCASGAPQPTPPNSTNDHHSIRGPIYPKTLWKKNIQGSVDAVCDIYTDGRAHNCRIKSSTHPLFSEATLDYIYKARYQPAERNGRPVIEYDHKLHVNYTIGD